jgi:hypothetical protein
MPPYYTAPLLLLNRLERCLQALVKLLQIAGLRQNRVSQSIEEDAFGSGGPTRATNKIQNLCMVLIARETAYCLFDFAEFALETLDLVNGGLRF